MQGDIRGPLSRPLYPSLVRLVSRGPSPLFTPAGRLLVLSLSPDPKMRSPPKTTHLTKLWPFVSRWGQDTGMLWSQVSDPVSWIFVLTRKRLVKSCFVLWQCFLYIPETVTFLKCRWMEIWVDGGCMNCGVLCAAPVVDCKWPRMFPTMFKPRAICNFTRGNFAFHLAGCGRHSSVTLNLQRLPRQVHISACVTSDCHLQWWLLRRVHFNWGN